MGRVIGSVITYGNNEFEGGFTFMGSGLVVMLGVVAVSISVISLLIFACADHSQENSPRKRSRCSGDGGECLWFCCGDGGGGDGGGDGGGGGAGCGGGGGGGGGGG